MTHTIGGLCSKAVDATIVRPISVVWVIASVMIAMAFQDAVYIVACIVVLGIAALGAVVLSVRTELEVVHRLVNSQHDLLVARVEQLTEALEDHAVPVPEPISLRHRRGA